MPDYTENYNLKKPRKSENYNIDDVTRDNADLIDKILYQKVEKVAGKDLSQNDFTDLYKKKLDAVNKIYVFCGSVDTYNDLPITNLKTGDTYNVKSEKKTYAWSGTTWVEIGLEIDLTQFASEEELKTLIAAVNTKIENLEVRSKKHIMTAGLTDDYTTTRTNYEKININKVFCVSGDKLTITEEGIKIGAEVSKVKVSGQIYFYTNLNSSVKNASGYIEKNGTTVVAHNQRGDFEYVHVALPEKVIDVKEGDVIGLGVVSKQDATVIKNYENGTFLTVEVVE